MRVPAVLRTARARRDLLEIWSYVADRSGPERADKLLNRIDERCDRLAQLPGMGRLRPDLGPAFRGYTIPRTKYIVVYRQTPEASRSSAWSTAPAACRSCSSRESLTPEPLDPQLPQDAEPAAEPTGLEPMVPGDELRTLIAQLEDLDTVAVNRAARQLAEMGPPAEAAVPGLLRQLVYHPVRSEACRALVRVATPRSLPILAAALMQRESAWDVAASLETIGPPTIPMLVSAAVGGGPDAQLPAFGAPAAMLAAHPYDAGPAVPMLLAALRHDRPDIRCGAAGMLGDIGPAAAEAAPALAGLLRDTRTRDAAEAALEQISQDPESHGC